MTVVVKLLKPALAPMLLLDTDRSAEASPTCWIPTVPVVSDVLSSCAKALTLPPKAGDGPVSTKPVKICRFKDKSPSLVALVRLSVVIVLEAWLPNTDDKTLLSETVTGKLPPLPVKEEKYVALLIGAMMSALPTWGLTHWL